MNPYTKIPNKLFEMGLNAFEIAVYAYISKCGDKAFPSINNIADKCGISRRTAQRTIESLEDKSIIKKQARYKDNKQSSNEYKIILGVSHRHTEKETYTEQGYHMKSGRYYKGNKPISMSEYQVYWCMHIPGEVYKLRCIDPYIMKDKFTWLGEEDAG